MSTHLGLVARAFGADGMYLVGGEPHVKDSIDDVSKRWGGSFEIQLRDDWRNIVREWKAKDGIIVHLTMYGLHVDGVINEIKGSGKDLLVVVGAKKVPKDLYHSSDFNVAIGHQPHSEIAAVAIFLDRLFLSEELKRNFKPSNIRVVPSAKGKKVETVDVKDRI
jgi:tRNA (cytidine56-2'-O)-methyltransferase